MNSLQRYFLNAGIDQNEIEKVVSPFKPKNFEKGDYFVKEGRVSLQLGFIESGLFQYYTLTEKSEERTTYIALEGTLVASLLTYLQETPSRENIRAISKSVLWIVSKNDVQRLIEDLPSFRDFYRRIIEWQICCIDKSRFDLIALSAEQRYQKLMEEEPQLLQKVPLQYIASMIGVSPRHLSRLRGKVVL